MQQPELPFERRGGKRERAGRKPSGPKSREPHAKREPITRSKPVHANLHLRKGLPSLRLRSTWEVVSACLEAARERNGMRIIHFSVPGNHLHLIVEAEDRDALKRGMIGLIVRLTKQLQKLWSLQGPIFEDRHHEEVIACPRQARNTLRYVLHNARRHEIELSSSIDPLSSALAFDSWIEPSIPPQVLPTCVPPRSWVLREGWKLHGLISQDDIPQPAPESKRTHRSKARPATSKQSRSTTAVAPAIARPSRSDPLRPRHR
jgi:putative transposase